ncbi:MAG: isocitrate lyase/phosphoenolpyruvate mutase family protein, partial [Oscillospiraceae bacterium]|nr:isocitrate lyase/phosphoenolpyruvate mutase family protein [Oscillospiraceae bacterium]
MIILIDNYDSFSYNLFQFVGELNPDIKVVRNDELTPEEILALKPTHAIISPGPGRPSEAGIIEEFVRTAAGKLPILGVCLGHQALSENFCEKIAAGKKVQLTDDFMIVARIESLILERGMEDALERAHAYVKAGADGIMIHSRKKDPAEIFEFCDKF